MGTTPTLKLPYPDPSTAIDIAEHIKKLAEAIDIALSAAPPGVIVPFRGTTVPAGWHLCDGSAGTPNLTGKFVIGSDATHAPGVAVGSNTVSLVAANIPSHTHTVTVANGAGAAHTHTAGSSTFTVAAGGAHQHSMASVTATHAGTAALDHVNGNNNDEAIEGWWTLAAADSHSHSRTPPPLASSAYTPAVHTHTVTASQSGGATTVTPITITPPYYQLAYIMKV